MKTLAIAYRHHDTVAARVAVFGALAVCALACIIAHTALIGASIALRASAARMHTTEAQISATYSSLIGTLQRGVPLSAANARDAGFAPALAQFYTTPRSLGSAALPHEL